jgi:hypothetical protein
MLLLSRIGGLILAVVLIDVAAASFASDPAVRWLAVAVAVLYALAVAFGWRRAPMAAAAGGMLALTGLFAIGESLMGADSGLTMTGLSPGSALAIVTGLVLLLCGTAVALWQAPIALRVTIPAGAIVAVIPFALAVAAGTMGAAFYGVFGWVAWSAVNLLLPIAAGAAVVVAVLDGIHKRWANAAAAGIACLALVACVQAGARAGGEFGKPSILAAMQHATASQPAAPIQATSTTTP